MTQATTRSFPRNAGEENLTKEQAGTRIDEIVDALFSTSAGTTAPTSPILGMQWLDTSAAPYRLKLWDGVQWATLGAFDPTTGRFNAYSTTNSGSARPAGAAGGTLWLKTNATPWILYLFDGADDIALMSVNATTNEARPTDGSITTAKFSAATLVLASEGIQANDNDTSIPTSAAVLDLFGNAGSSIMIVTDHRANGVGGGTALAGSWRARPLNTVEYNNISGASLASDRITLPAGTYRVRATSPLGNAGPTRHKSRLWNVNDGIVLVHGSSEFNGSGGSQMTSSTVLGTFVLGAPKAVELQYYTGTTASLGIAAFSGDEEVYAQVEIQRKA